MLSNLRASAGRGSDSFVLGFCDVVKVHLVNKIDSLGWSPHRMAADTGAVSI
jgi:hypothetical protein